MAGSFAISVLLATAMLVLKIQTLNTWQWDMRGDVHEGLLEANGSVYGDEKEMLLEGMKRHR